MYIISLGSRIWQTSHLSWKLLCNQKQVPHPNEISIFLEPLKIQKSSTKRPFWHQVWEPLNEVCVFFIFMFDVYQSLFANQWCSSTLFIDFSSGIVKNTSLAQHMPCRANKYSLRHSHNKRKRKIIKIKHESSMKGSPQLLIFRPHLLIPIIIIHKLYNKVTKLLFKIQMKLQFINSKETKTKQSYHFKHNIKIDNYDGSFSSNCGLW